MFSNSKLEQLEHPMITHTIDQFILDPGSKQDKVKVTNLKNLQNLILKKYGEIDLSQHWLR